MSGIVSFSLFGKDPHDIYYPGSLRNAEAYLRYAPDVSVRFYVGRLPWEWASKNLATLPNVELVKFDTRPEDQTATMWRFLALKDSGYDFYLFRDVDSRPIERERVAVQEWLDSNRQFHVMRDHPYHNVPMMAGLWGVRGEMGTKISRFFPEQYRRAYYQCDQMFLRTMIWRVAKTDLMAHVGCDHAFGTETVDFTVPLGTEGFVGEGFYGSGLPRFPEHNRAMVG